MLKGRFILLTLLSSCSINSNPPLKTLCYNLPKSYENLVLRTDELFKRNQVLVFSDMDYDLIETKSSENLRRIRQIKLDYGVQRSFLDSFDQSLLNEVFSPGFSVNSKNTDSTIIKPHVELRTDGIFFTHIFSLSRNDLGVQDTFLLETYRTLCTFGFEGWYEPIINSKNLDLDKIEHRYLMLFLTLIENDRRNREADDYGGLYFDRSLLKHAQ